MSTNKTPEEIRALGKKFLDELKLKGPNLDKVGKTVVRMVGNNFSNINDNEDEDEPISKARQFRKMKIDLANERKELDEILKKESDNDIKD
jgi:hypothetical protein